MARRLDRNTEQDARYLTASRRHAPAIERLARGYEANADLRRDLVQDIHAALWRSFARFEGGCSERTWVFRVAHNVAASHATTGQRARGGGLVSLDEIETLHDGRDTEADAGDRLAAARLLAAIERLRPGDRQVMLLYLEDFSASEIAEVTGLSPGAVAVRVHRIKALLAAMFQPKGEDR